MITRLQGILVEKKEQSLIVKVQGISYDVMVPLSIIQRIDDIVDKNGQIELVTYHYFQMSMSSGIPILVGFVNEVERDFFQQFIKVSGIGPRAAVKALNKPISEIAKAIHQGDVSGLKSLPGIGLQRAKEIVAKLQGKIGKFGLIQDAETKEPDKTPVLDWQEEALSVLLQLQYKKHEALDMIKKALENNKSIDTTEDLLNEIYKQKVIA